MKKFLLPAFMLVLSISTLPAQTPYMLKDIINGAVGGFETASQYAYYNHPFNVVWEKNGFIYFTAVDYSTVPNGGAYTNDVELWKSDGTPGGTVLVKDINPGNDGSYPANFTEINGTLYFTAYTNSSGRELWKTDGTTSGTVMVKEIISGNVGGFETASQYAYYSLSFQVVWQIGNTFYFIANSYASVPNGSSYNNDVELWKSDGTDAGTVRVKDIYPGLESSYPGDFTEINGTLYFTAYNATSGRELWKTDGTTAGTVIVKEIISGNVGGFQTSSQYVYYNLPFRVVWQNGNTFYFVANAYASEPIGSSYTNDVELWKSDGTDAGTVRVKDIYPGLESSYPEDFFVFNGTLFFSAYNDVSGRELWKTDGTTNGTVIVKEIISGSIGGFDHAVQFGYAPFSFNVVWQHGGYFYFLANSYSSYPAQEDDIELWKSDGTTAGTVLVKDINPGHFSSNAGDFKEINGTLFFTAYNNSSGRELWKTDGTTGGTMIVKEIISGAVGGFETAGQNWYNSYPFSVIWQSGNTFYFVANGYASVPNGSTYTNNVELWKSDGTDAGTVMVKDINPGNEGSYPQNFNLIDGNLYFTASTTSGGRELWKSDGTNGGTVLVKEIMSGPVGGFEQASQYAYVNSSFFVAFNIGSYFYFLANDYASVPNGSGYENNVELWKSDGTTGGTSKVMEINPSGTTGCYAMNFTAVLGKIFFTAIDGSHGRELWVIDIPVSDGPELSQQNTWSVFPNPAHNELHVAGDTRGTFTITDVRGRQVLESKQLKSGEGSGFDFDISILEPGMYLITSTDGNTRMCRKIVKQ